MPLPNRVTPFSTIEAVSSRGTLMGNRGILHKRENDVIVLQSLWKHKSWISCVLDYYPDKKNPNQRRRRKMMQPRSYTELFFLDEVTAMAAGHRPCALCSRDRYRSFQQAWERAKLPGPPSAKTMDSHLHEQKVPMITLEGPTSSTHPRLPWKDVPAFAMFRMSEDSNEALVKLDSSDMPLRWTHNGYERINSLYRMEPTTEVVLLTCPAMCQVLRYGYQPMLHPSATTVGTTTTSSTAS